MLTLNQETIVRMFIEQIEEYKNEESKKKKDSLMILYLDGYLDCAKNILKNL